MLPSMSSMEIGPVLPAISLVPARMTTTSGLEIDHVLAEAQEHLRGGLSADAAIDVVLAGEILAEGPLVGDGVAIEDDAMFAGDRVAKLLVGSAIAMSSAKSRAQSAICDRWYSFSGWTDSTCGAMAPPLSCNWGGCCCAWARRGKGKKGKECGAGEPEMALRTFWKKLQTYTPPYTATASRCTSPRAQNRTDKLKADSYVRKPVRQTTACL